MNGGIIVSFHDRKRISVLLENHNGMFVSDAYMIACLDPAEIAVFCNRCIFAKHFITDFSTQGNTSITLTVRGFPEILPVFVCPGQTLFVSLFHSHNLTSGLFCGNFFTHADLAGHRTDQISTGNRNHCFSRFDCFYQTFFIYCCDLRIGWLPHHLSGRSITHKLLCFSNTECHIICIHRCGTNDLYVFLIAVCRHNHSLWGILDKNAHKKYKTDPSLYISLHNCNLPPCSFLSLFSVTLFYIL